MINLNKLKTWDEPNNDGAFPRGTLRIYCGYLLCGYAVPKRNSGKYYFRDACQILNVPSESFQLEDILMHVECSLKEFVKKISTSTVKTHDEFQIQNIKKTSEGT